MDETMKRLLDGVLLVLNNASDFISKETPDIIQQYLQYVNIDLTYNLYICGAIFLICAGLGLFFMLSDIADDTARFIFSLICFFGVIIAVGCFCDNIKALKQLNVAPKIYIMKDAAKLLQHKE